MLVTVKDESHGLLVHLLVEVIRSKDGLKVNALEDDFCFIDFYAFDFCDHIWTSIDYYCPQTVLLGISDG